MSVVALVDCNNFFASCERIFRPDLINKPVVVLSNNDGCVIARSSEAKKLGIPMGAPYFKYKDLILKNKVYFFGQVCLEHMGRQKGERSGIREER